MNSFERRLKIYEYNAAVTLAACSFIPSLREQAQTKAGRLAKELGFIEESK